MSAGRRVWIPAAAGVAAAVVVFAAVLLATSGGGGGRAGGANSAGGGAAGSASTSAAAAPTASSPHDVAAGRLVFAEMGCGSCHRLAAAGSSGPIGPVLDGVLPRHTRASLLAKIRDPGAGSIMPGDFARRMTPAQLGALVDFLLAARSGGAG
jgi:mono/diheme cytochrome c family protein